MKNILFLSLASLLLASCSEPEKLSADLIIHNAVVYTVDSLQPEAECFAIKDGKILAVGKSDSIMALYNGELLDAGGKSIFPGFIDAHCHFYGYGRNLSRADLVGTGSFDEVVQKVVEFANTLPTSNDSSRWILGRGWDQNDWEVKEFPDKHKLDSLFSDTPVLLTRIDGHAALANSEALRRAGVDANSKLTGGLVEVKDGEVTGILIDNAIGLVSSKIPSASDEEIKFALQAAEKNCLAAGLTTIDDAGLSKKVVEIIDQMHKDHELKMRVYAMMSDSKENLEYYLNQGPVKTDRLNIRAFKFYADGALGSRGACLLEPYSDKPDQQGFLLSEPEYFLEMAEKMADKGFQMATHCIGDSAHRYLLEVYGKALKGKNDKRWRIEHAQVTNPADFKMYTEFDVIPSAQSTHCTSDMYWADERLGEPRVKGAYAYKELLEAAGTIALGTDFPVENINPMYTFYASVARKDLKGWPENGWQTENALSREETLKGMTLWAAHSNFEEDEKGSISPGKFADFVILDKDIMKIKIDEVPNVKVLYTFVNGEMVHLLKQ